MQISPDDTFPSNSPAFRKLRDENEALRTTVESLADENAQLRAMLSALELELEKIRKDTGRHSGISSKPPSSDTLAQRSSQNADRMSRQQRRAEARAKLKEMTAKPQRKPGKQPGAPGANLAKVADPEHVEVHSPPCCGGCGGDLSAAEVVSIEARQVHDLPRRKLEVTAHQAETRRCACGTTTKALFPAQAKAVVCYGPMVRAVAVYLTVFQHVPVARAAALLSEVCGAPVSTGFVASLAVEAAGGLNGFMDELRRQLRAGAVLHADETGARINGSRYWFHVACTDMLSLLDCHERRGSGAFADVGVLPFFSGVLVSDGYKSYFSSDLFDNALCCAHLLRDIASVATTPRHAGWADDMADLLIEAKRAVEKAVAEGGTGMNRYELQLFRTRYTKIVNAGFAAVPARHRTGTIDRDAYNLLKRFDSQRADVQRHWVDGRVSFDNNVAERDLRMVKLQQKVSGCWRTLEGARYFCAIRSYIHTARKQGEMPLQVLLRLFNGDPWMPPASASP